MASSEPTQKTFKVAITTKMLCQGCADTIKVVTEQVHYIKHTSVNLNTQSAEITAVIGACICEPDGNGNMPKCLCIEKGIVSAVQSAGFESVISPCRGPDGVARQPCVAAQSGRRRFVVFVVPPRPTRRGPARYFKCTCGPDCQCGDDCQCRGCPAWGAVPEPGDNYIMTASVATMLIAIGYVWAKWKFAESLFA